MNKLKTVKTGDVMCFKGNTPTSFLLRFLTAGNYNHVGIAVRMIKTEKGWDVSLTEEGELFVYETNANVRHDKIFDQELNGAGYSDVQWTLSKYNKCFVRRLRDDFRTEELKRLTMEFCETYKGSKFPTKGKPFFNVWLQTKSGKDEEVIDELICSELVAHYYNVCVGGQFDKVVREPYRNITDIFGPGSPDKLEMYSPNSFSYSNSPLSKILPRREEEVFRDNGALLFTIIQPLILVIFMMIVIAMIFRDM